MKSTQKRGANNNKFKFSKFEFKFDFAGSVDCFKI